MKKQIILLLTVIFISACEKSLDRFPIDNPSSATFFSTQQEMELAANGLYNISYLNDDSETWSDNMWQRSGGGNFIIHGASDSQTSFFSDTWTNSYKAIYRSNAILENLNKPTSFDPAVKSRIEGEARFIRGYNYCQLAIHFGNVPLITTSLSIEEAKNVMQNTRAEVLKFAFDDLDKAADLLPKNYPTGIKRFTKGAALAIKARFALYDQQYDVAEIATKAVMDLNIYNLYPSYRDLFLKAGETSSEIILSLPRSAAYNVDYDIQYTISRNAGGYASNIPTLALIDSYECTDGKTIDKSPLYNPKDPFTNRDPRLKATIVMPGDKWLGYIFQNNPDIKTVLNYNTNKLVNNNDNNTVNLFASYTGYLFKKFISDDIALDYKNVDLDKIYVRYADILLMYAEAKIEQNKIDASVLATINMVRARAYQVNPSQVSLYPAVTTTDQTVLRKILRRERRVEFVYEGLRYRDILRWKLAPKVFNRTIYGYPLDKSDWPFVQTPVFDDDDIPSYSSFGSKLRVLDVTSFDINKHYIWPIPYGELILDKNLKQADNW
ncbi:RagB/SusD family nutrient uptake outer membrane protein [Pedobacter sp. SD-b]|uniref:RagB/SusD family nutrient uptake outer membrane protein n=1 Tax=Pedobacter segetis TaxID=2793069 RepID=A0ABS1BGG8_9SPHI|nr:RagB/SusD family nutrient uptake outer membrane protein [Pedobacter segetis]MBK0381943.1 RagB/SusD family nutrient uptake outer membrane protein [Pedobacter segetis]